jgi:hypothetical protein
MFIQIYLIKNIILGLRQGFKNPQINQKKSLMLHEL